MEGIINFLKKKLADVQQGIIGSIFDNQGKFTLQPLQRPISNVVSNLQMIANPQTRGDWFRGFTPQIPQQISQPISNLKQNISLLSNPQTRATFLQGFAPQMPESIRQPISNLKTNLSLLSNPQTRGTYLQGFMPQEPTPLRNLRMNLQLITKSPQFAESIPQALEEKTIEIGKKFGTGGELAGRFVGGLEKGFSRLGTTFFTKKSTPQKIGDVIAGIGAVAFPVESGTTALLNPIFTTAKTLLTKKRLPTKDELMKSYSEGLEFATEFTPINKFTSPVVGAILKKYNPQEIKTAVDVMKRLAVKGIGGGATFGTYGYFKTGKAKDAVDNAIMGALFDMGTEATGMAGKALVKKIKSFWTDVMKLPPNQRKAIFKEAVESRIGFQIRETKDELTRLVSQAVKNGNISVEEGQAILGTLKEAKKIPIKPLENKIPIQSPKTTPPPKTIPVGESGGEVGGYTPLKERSFFKTAEESKATPSEVLESLKTSKERYYTLLSNPDLLSKAEQTISKYGFDEVYKKFTKNELPIEENLAVGELLARKAFKEQRFEEGFKILEELGKKGTEYGRGVQSLSIWSRLTPEGMVKYADILIERAKENYSKSFTGKLFKKLDISLTNEEKKIIYKTMQEAQTASDEATRLEYTKKALKMISDKIPVGLGDFFEVFRYNNMLSGPLTHQKNILQNIWNTYFTPAFTLLTEGKPKEFAQYEIAAIKSIPKALDDFFASLKDDIDIDLRKVETFVESQKYKKIPKPFRFFSDLMESEDIFFRRIITAGFEATGKSKEEAMKLANEYLLRIPSSTRGKGVISDSLRAMGGGIEAFGRIFRPIRWFVPFVRTVINAAIQQLEYSPVSFANIVGNEAKRTQLAKSFLGSIATLIGAKLALEGRITWSAPTDEMEKRFFYAQHKKPFSIKLGNKWVPVSYFGPFAFALLLPAAIKYYYEEAPGALTDSDWEKLAKSLSSIIYYWSQSTPMSGLGGFVRTAQGDVDYSVARNLGFTAQQVIPYSGLLRWINNFVDDVYRKPKGFVEQFASSIPGLQKAMGVEAYTEPTGEEARRDLINQFLPYSIGFEKENASFYQQLEKERQEERQVNRYINQLKKDFKEKKPLTEEQLKTIIPPQEETPFNALVERKKLEDLYAKGDQLFDLYFRAPNDEMRQKIQESVVKLGLDFNEGLYNYLTKQETDIKTSYVKAVVEKLEGEKRWESLVSFRKDGIASGKQLLSSGVIDNLVDEGVLTEEEGRLLKNITYDRKTGKFKSKGKGKKISIKEPPKLRFKQASISTPKLKIPKIKKLTKGTTVKIKQVKLTPPALEKINSDKILKLANYQPRKIKFKFALVKEKR